MAGPDEQKNLHANRPSSIPWDGKDGPKNVYSRSDILTDKTPTAFADGEIPSINGENSKDPSTWPTIWPKAGRVLRVPKVVILSSLPFWTVFWKSCTLYGPRDVIGEMFTPPYLFGNYYYFEQWDDVDTTTMAQADYSWTESLSSDQKSALTYCSGPAPAYPSEPFDYPGYNQNAWWSNFDTSTALKTGYGHLETYCASTGGDDCCENIPHTLINTCTAPPDERYFRIICSVLNPVLTLHQQLITAFQQVKIALESDLIDPIQVIIPQWIPFEEYQIRNSSLMATHEEPNPLHGGAINNQACEVNDSIDCYNDTPRCWWPAYPNVNDPRNDIPFNSPTVPWLHCPVPGFGTNVLHLYVGHAVINPSNSNKIWDYQAWPFSPEISFYSSFSLGTYLGSSLPYYAGRRAVWRDAGLNYGYMNNGARGLYDNIYGTRIAAAAEEFKTNSLNYRNYGVRTFQYPTNWNNALQWNLSAIWADQKRWCPGTQFYFGNQTFTQFANSYDGVDTSIIDCSGHNNGLKVGESQNNFPDTPGLQLALSTFYPPIQQRVVDYYTGIEPGTKEFLDYAIQQTGLADSNVVNEGMLPGAMLDPDGLIEYIRNYFKQFPS